MSVTSQSIIATAAASTAMAAHIESVGASAPPLLCAGDGAGRGELGGAFGWEIQTCYHLQRNLHFQRVIHNQHHRPRAPTLNPLHLPIQNLQLTQCLHRSAAIQG
ncbi:hypothetical protein PsorP6_005889 [Peronosclerospora sorghi]|uniref:Uncharacterized protein n=1 Tax=Peronosclerospora sorghi TaxID=230839 RepID=A0ACC0W352_9STRA|nr:hypothetical protein PsorP6_005889 [Peronosclerospora sorghi]